MNVHPTCKRATADKRFGWATWGWPLKDSGKQHKEVLACCEGWTGTGIMWRGQELPRRQMGKHDAVRLDL